jgi:hypothetical protein
MIDRKALRASLSEVADEAAGLLESDRTTNATRRALEGAAPLLLAIPVAALVVALFRRVFGLEVTLPSPWLIAFLTPLPAILFVAQRIASARAQAVSRLAALGAVDDKDELGDRLANAWEFIERETQGPFVEAALADAEAHLDRAGRVPLGGGAAELNLRSRDLLCGGAALLALVALPFLGRPHLDDDARAVDAGDANRAIAQVESRAEGRRDETRPRSEKTAAPRPEATKPPVPGGISDGAARRDDQPLSRDMKKTRGEVGAGRSADASSSSGSSEARGTPTDQAQASESSKKKTKKKKKKKDRGRKEAEAPPKKEPGEESGATAGRGAASGSNKSPAQSTWSSKDQVVSDDEEDLEDDEEVDDEFEDNEARGGVQPQLRDRKPPVNRDLGIGFGNRSNPDANGRGGPSEQKKSRGVASLVLGVPIPDHVKGRPNPGKTKITQERVEPREDRGAIVDASSRPRRGEVSGQGARPALDPWLRTLVRGYFEARRRADARSENREPTQ